jgi:hypothetical protein
MEIKKIIFCRWSGFFSSLILTFETKHLKEISYLWTSLFHYTINFMLCHWFSFFFHLIIFMREHILYRSSLEYPVRETSWHILWYNSI